MKRLRRLRDWLQGNVPMWLVVVGVVVVVVVWAVAYIPRILDEMPWS